MGFDGIMINEHHTAPFCMQASINITGTVLAKITRRGKILMLGNPLPVVDNPLRLAEELAMIDCISRGRLISGFVRGGGVEAWSITSIRYTTASASRRRMTSSGRLDSTWSFPMGWQALSVSVVNPWALPLQPPPMMVPGTASPETVIWAARHRYPYVVLGSSLEQTKELIAIYQETAQEEATR